jgi:hypothetical protein
VHPSKIGLSAALIHLGAIASALAADPIKIGVVTPLTGTYAGIGQQVRWGSILRRKKSMRPAARWDARWN